MGFLWEYPPSVFFFFFQGRIVLEKSAHSLSAPKARKPNRHAKQLPQQDQIEKKKELLFSCNDLRDYRPYFLIVVNAANSN